MKRKTTCLIVSGWIAGTMVSGAAGIIISNVAAGPGDTLYARNDNTLMSGGLVTMGYFPAGVKEEDLDTIPELLAQLSGFTTVTSAVPGSYSGTLGGSFAGYVDQASFTSTGIVTVSDPLFGRTIYSVITDAATLSAAGRRSQFAVVKIANFREDLPVENQYTSNPPGLRTLIGTYDLFVGDAGAGDGIYNTLKMDFVPAPTYVISSCSGTLAGGTVEGTGVYDEGESVTVTAKAGPGYRFIDWEGAYAGLGNPVQLTLLEPLPMDIELCPVFERDDRDTDEDGLTNYEEVAVHGTDPEKWDTDGDGLSDGYELGLGQFSVVYGNFTWEEAQADALSRDGYLATFATQNEWESMLRSVPATALDGIDGLWIGATDRVEEGGWKWITGEVLTFANWAAGEPDDYNDSDYASVAGELAGRPGMWYDYRGAITRDGYLLEVGFSSSPLLADTDADGLDDDEERRYGTNPWVVDTDSDGLGDGGEVNRTLTDPRVPDSDGDGVLDGDEDPDGDGLANGRELNVLGTDPLKRDSNGDGLSDGLAVQLALDPMSDQSEVVALVLETRGHLQLEPGDVFTAERPGSVRVPVTGGKAGLRLKVQTSTDFSDWSDGGEAVYEESVDPATSPNPFYRYEPKPRPE